MAAPVAGFRQAASNPGRNANQSVEALIAGLEAEDPRAKYRCARELRDLSEKFPEQLYPHFDFVAALLDHENKILQWNAAIVLSHLASVDSKHKFDGLFEKYFSPIRGPVMITAANVMRGAARIARARPEWADRIASEVLRVAGARYDTPECRNVAIGHAIRACAELLDLLEDQTSVQRFVRRQLKNTRAATRKKAEQFFKTLNTYGSQNHRRPSSKA